IDIDFTQKFTHPAAETFDKNTLEVIAYDRTGQPVIFDTSRPGDEKYLLPWRVDDYYGINKVTLNFILPGDNYTYMAYFDSQQSGLGKAARYHGLVGDGDRFTEGYKRREINACG